MIMTLLALAATPVAAPAARAAPIARADRVREADLAPHIRILASDEYEGRKPGTVASGKTLSYIATAWARAGLEPGAADGSWFQPVELVDRSLGASDVRWSMRGKPVDVPAEIVLVGPRERQELRGPVTYVGYGLDPKPEDVRGRIVLFQVIPPPAALNAPGPQARVEALRKAGAIAVINIGYGVPPGATAPVSGGAATTWEQIRPLLTRMQTSRPTPADPNAGATGFMSSLATDRLLRAAGQDPVKLATAARVAGFRPVPLGVDLDATITTNIRNYVSHNVVARLPGTGASGEAVAIIAHWDHLGLCRPEGAPDRICNGAVDNASGIAVMIEVAERLGRGKRSARDIVFVATTAEESGLLGAGAYVDAPSVPLDKIVGVLNIDTIAIGPRGLPVSAVNRGNTKIDPLIDEIALRLGRTLDADLDANGFIQRQDGAAFTRVGVPSVMAGGSFADMTLLQAFLGGAYHGPDDEWSDALALGGAAEDAELHVLLARALADPNRYAPGPRVVPKN